ncbi:hypothetical protein [Actinomadura madurae]|uniref:AraC-like ligand-binding domain-containing protein n=1 Tax=Actinomadura madurae TaxID=1993 RepID=UPI0020D22D9D|nr:hypothetical protein [Actinomadura madurae]MCQ0017842.1 hypothetical protein [Actinomadura madurae]
MTSLDISPPLSAHQRIVSTDIDLLHDTVEPFAVGHDLQAIEPQVPLDGQVNALGLGAVNLVWVRYGGGGVIVDTPPTEGHFALCAPQAPMGVEYRATKTSETAGDHLVLSHDESMRMKPHATLGCLVIATSTGRLADHLAATSDATTPRRCASTRPGRPSPNPRSSRAPGGTCAPSSTPPPSGAGSIRSRPGAWRTRCSRRSFSACRTPARRPSPRNPARPPTIWPG